MRKRLILLGATTIALALSTTSCFKGGDDTKEDQYKDGKLLISLRNLYFSNYAGGDDYLKEVENKFQVSFSFDAYQWANWETQVIGQVNGRSMPDVFHANIDSYNFANLYKYWAEEEIIKPLPEDLSRWPNFKRMIDNSSNINALRIDGKLYGIPIAKNTTDYSTSFSPFTYVYRRDWAKEFGVYKENDEYTWQEFQDLVRVFHEKLSPKGKDAFADVEWGFPSLINFYKQVPHCFAQDASGNYVNCYTTDKYIEGMNFAKSFMDNGYHYSDQNSARDGDMNIRYYSNQLGILYENLSYSNLYDLKTNLRSTNSSNTDFNVEDATAIMKIKGPDGKYALEGTDNWFSMTFFDYRISDNKMNKLLDIYDWLLGEEGTTFSIYGFEGYDYEIVNNEIKLIETAWPKDGDDYIPKNNGAKYLRYMVSLGYDTLAKDPLTDKKAVKYLEDWEAEMKQELASGNLRVLKETAEVMWLTTPLKASFSGKLRTEALNTVMNYVMQSETGERMTEAQYKSVFENDGTWSDVLNEINATL